jgi:hypothetical protein
VGLGAFPESPASSRDQHGREVHGRAASGGHDATTFVESRPLHGEFSSRTNFYVGVIVLFALFIGVLIGIVIILR